MRMIVEKKKSPKCQYHEKQIELVRAMKKLGKGAGVAADDWVGGLFEGIRLKELMLT